MRPCRPARRRRSGYPASFDRNFPQERPGSSRSRSRRRWKPPLPARPPPRERNFCVCALMVFDPPKDSRLPIICWWPRAAAFPTLHEACPCVARWPHRQHARRDEHCAVAQRLGSAGFTRPGAAAARCLAMSSSPACLERTRGWPVEAAMPCKLHGRRRFFRAGRPAPGTRWRDGTAEDELQTVVRKYLVRQDAGRGTSVA